MQLPGADYVQLLHVVKCVVQLAENTEQLAMAQCTAIEAGKSYVIPWPYAVGAWCAFRYRAVLETEQTRRAEKDMMQQRSHCIEVP